MLMYKPTGNILDRWMALTPDNEVPKVLFEWACYTTVAAAVADRVGFWYKPVRPIHPNIFVFMVCDSGLGKGQALDFAAQFLQPEMRYMNGTFSKQSIIDHMAGEIDSPPELDHINTAARYIHSSELAYCIGEDALAKSLVKSMTEWYTGDAGTDGTRKHGNKKYPRPCLTWNAGTTDVWLSECVSYNALRSGFLGRVIPVTALRSPRMKPKIERPEAEYQIARDHLRARFEDLCHLKGDMEYESDAWEYAQDWYMERPKETSVESAWFAREMINMIKLSMIMSLCDNMSMRITLEHAQKAVTLVERGRRDYRHVISELGTRDAYHFAQEIAETLQRAGKAGMSKTQLLRKYSRNLDTSGLNYLLDSLMQVGEVENFKRPGSDANYYRYIPPVLLQTSRVEFGRDDDTTEAPPS